MNKKQKNEFLPKGWRKVKLGNIVEFKNGLNTEKKYYGNGIKFVNVMDIFRHNHLYSRDIIGSVQVTEKQKNEYSVKYGDILFNRTSETLEEVAMSSVYLDKEEVLFGGFVIRGRPKINIFTPKYSVYCLQTTNVRKNLIRRGQGAVRANIGQKDLSKIAVLLPPLSEQKRIVEILSTWDQAIEKLEKLISAKQKKFKWLLKTLITDQQSNLDWQKKVESNTTLNVKQLKSRIKANLSWNRVNLKTICKVFIDGDWIELKDQSKGGIRLIQTGNIGIGKYLDKPDKARFVSEKTFEDLKCTEVLPGDILVSRLPEPVGRSCVVPQLKTKMITAVDCTIIRVDKRKVIEKFLIYFMASKKILY